MISLDSLGSNSYFTLEESQLRLDRFANCTYNESKDTYTYESNNTETIKNIIENWGINFNQSRLINYDIKEKKIFLCSPYIDDANNFSFSISDEFNNICEVSLKYLGFKAVSLENNEMRCFIMKIYFSTGKQKYILSDDKHFEKKNNSWVRTYSNLRGGISHAKDAKSSKCKKRKIKESESV